jgi:hypothetical protein
MQGIHCALGDGNGGAHRAPTEKIAFSYPFGYALSVARMTGNNRVMNSNDDQR